MNSALLLLFGLFLIWLVATKRARGVVDAIMQPNKTPSP